MSNKYNLQKFVDYVHAICKSLWQFKITINSFEVSSNISSIATMKDVCS